MKEFMVLFALRVPLLLSKKPHQTKLGRSFCEVFGCPDGGREESDMQIEERVVNNVTILDLKGKITLGEGDEALKDKINSLIQQDRKRILLNLGDVPYIDSAGLGEIVRTYTTVSRQGGQLKLVHLTKRITDLLSITKLLTVFETFDSEPEALKSFT